MIAKKSRSEEFMKSKGPAILVTLTLLHVAAANAAIVKVKDLGTTATSSGTSIFITVPAGGVAAGDVVLLQVAIAGTPAVALSTSDPKLNAYSADFTSNTSALTVATFRGTVGTALAAGDLITVTWSPAAPAVASAAEFAGLTSSPLDQSGWGVGSSLLPATSAIPATTQANELLLGAVSTLGSSVAFTPGSGYTALVGASQVIPGLGTLSIFPEFRTVAATGVYAADGTLGAPQTWNAIISTYKDVVAPVELQKFAIE
jgi:hypothetical protein